MRPLMVVLPLELVEATLLGAQTGPRGSGGLRFQRLVEALVPSVLLWLAGLDELGEDCEPEPARKAFESFSRDGAKSSDYYFQHDTAEEAGDAVFVAKLLVWGSSEPSGEQPDAIFAADTIAVVVSSRRPGRLSGGTPTQDRSEAAGAY